MSMPLEEINDTTRLYELCQSGFISLEDYFHTVLLSESPDEETVKELCRLVVFLIKKLTLNDTLTWKEEFIGRNIDFTNENP